ncbi:GntR family transcriptional regulator [Corynebacterium mendelii]|uniref:GntR family transcriptional regulator n=1 Tax=Corynebacterium mendelii TaxID=2765362 RepID=A0A939E125_9CORY|nr:GntR family transcriptional regulator [Corynebacterium mendelii]MBN9644743.1 GntR family transcriptional regulator [Corynebacterium mendelii]
MAGKKRPGTETFIVPDIDPLGDKALFLQIRDSIVHQVAAGNLAPGSRLPSVRMLADDLRINPATVKKAYNMLVDDGVAVTRDRSGTRIAVTATAKDTAEKDLARAVTEAVAFARARGLTTAKITSVVKKQLDAIAAG